ncbi:RND family efflux transporter, MFP subunit [Bradyrhizobium erythrophlei]|uniref:RND family efflux transporter, MFP subunit n=2 Tax=Bradyrhizobium erythrophlei TaxID=1437360 RepID=A0A1M5L888_9BRAD|nr:RND family efflux transporter, MFP subunit [Bradyrhizobium erythrophlei]
MSEHEDQAPDSIAAKRQPRKMPRLLGVSALALVIAVGFEGIWHRHSQEKAVAAWTDAAAIPTVDIVHPTKGPPGQQVILPGDIHAWYEAPIYARVNGYLKDWYFDFGAQVKKGQVLADIETPEIDAELTAAKAKLNAASAAVKVREAEAQFAKTTYARWRSSPPGVVSVQERDAKQAEFESNTARLNAAKADMAMAQADVDRLQSLQGFKQVVAPFDGVVTARETDIGALINAGSNGTARELFSVADIHKVRIYVKVPQRLTGNIHPGLTAELRLPQYPGKVFTAKATTTSRSVNTSSRTLLLELQADNPDGLLQPGTYVEAQLNLPSDPNTVLIPASAILFRQHGLEVALLGDDDKVTLKKISLGRNLGVQAEVTNGLVLSDRVVGSPPDSLGSGDIVRIAGPPAPDKPPNGSEKEAEAN